MLCGWGPLAAFRKSGWCMIIPNPTSSHSVYEVAQHMESFSQPHLQRHIIRVLWMARPAPLRRRTPPSPLSLVGYPPALYIFLPVSLVYLSFFPPPQPPL